MTEELKESSVETAKRNSRFLRGTIAQILAGTEESFEHDDMQLLKFHGSYQQDDRDARAAARKTGAGKKWIFMIRAKIPGGVLTADQYLALDALAERVTHNQSLRITTRQGLQFHGVIKGNLKETIRAINEACATTLGACGDVCRNVMAIPAPSADPGIQAARAFAQQIAAELAPHTRAYHELWLDGEKVDTGAASDEGKAPEAVEPLYRDLYLPRKFKVGIALPDDNSVDVHSHDVGLIALVEGGRVKGVNVLVGGGFGMTHGKANTFARLGTPLGSIEADNVVAACRLIAEIFRDTGDRSDRRHARLKYVIEERGIDWFREEFQRRASFELKPWVDIGQVRFKDHLGAHSQDNGTKYYGAHVANGRIIDGERAAYKTAFRRIVEELQPGVVLTPTQDILFTDLSEAGVDRVRAILDEHNVDRPETMTAVRRFALACPALPTCGLALSESERVAPGIVDDFETELKRLGLENEPIAIRMTGCPNGCARPYSADIAIVGRMKGKYDLYVGGSIHGDRLVDHYLELIPEAELVTAMRPLLEEWKENRTEGEGLGDYYQRAHGQGRQRITLSGVKDPVAKV